MPGGSVHKTSLAGKDAAASKGGLLSGPAQNAQHRLSLQGLMTRNKGTQAAPAQASTLAPIAELARAASPNPPASIATTNTTGDDDGEVSDPETPWTCTLHLRSRSLPPAVLHRRALGPRASCAVRRTQAESGYARSRAALPQGRHADQDTMPSTGRARALSPSPRSPMQTSCISMIIHVTNFIHDY